MRSDPKLLDAFRRQCLTAIRPTPKGAGRLQDEKIGLVFLAWQGQPGVTRDDLIDIVKEISRDPEPLRNCWPKRAAPPDWSGDKPPEEDVRTKFIVFRPGPGLPSGFMPERWDGWWITRESAGGNPLAPDAGQAPAAEAVATGRFERRDDGALAEIYEVGRPEIAPR